MNTTFVLMQALAWMATIAVMFGGALRLGPGSLRRVRKRPGLFLRTLAVVWIAVPVVTILVVLAFDVRGLSATTLMLMAVCPGMPLLLDTTRSVAGAAGTAFGALLLTATLEPMMIPYWTRLLSDVHPGDLTVQSHQVLAVLVPTVFLPVAIGFAVRRFAKRAAPRLARMSTLVGALGIGVDMVVVLIEGAPLLLHVPARAFAAAAVTTVGDVSLGYWAGWPRTQDQKAIAVASSLGNPALALAVMGGSLPDVQAGALVATYLIVRSMILAPIQWWLKRVRARRTRHVTR